jgi:hypothetical protein
MSDWDEQSAHRNRRPDKTYASPRLTKFGGAPVRIAHKVVDHQGGYAFAKQLDEIVLREVPSGRFEIIAKFTEDDRRILNVTIQKFNRSGPGKEYFTFRPNEVAKLLTFLANIKRIHFPDEGKLNIGDKDLEELLLTPDQAKRVFRGNEELIAALARTEVTSEDIIALGFRRAQLRIFERLLSEPTYFGGEVETNPKGPEGVWQDFFERNPWIFGYGLSYVFLGALAGKKLEQVVRGFDISGAGKRADAVLKSQALISSLCFVEIKRHDTDLLAAKSFRSGIWHPSSELVGAVSQVQGTVAAALEPVRSQLQLVDDQGAPTGETVHTVEPRSFLVIGSLEQFMTEHGVHAAKFKSFELFRRNTVRPEIITFDELFYRAKFIVDNASGR